MSGGDIEARMMARALECARVGRGIDEVPVGAVVWRLGDGEIVAEAHNEVEVRKDGTGHAELIAIQRAMDVVGAKRLAGCAMAVTLEPCAMCAGAIVHARIERLVYAAVDPKAGAVESLYQICTDARLNHRVGVVRCGGAQAEEAGEMLRGFFRAKRSGIDQD